MKKLLLSLGIILLSLTSFAQTTLQAHINGYNQPIIEIQINGKTHYLLYDTGASMTIINFYDVNSCMIELDNDTNNIHGIGGDNTISHTTKGVEFALSDKNQLYLELGVCVRDMNKICKQLSKGLGGKKVIGVLGMDVIKRMGISYNVISNTFIAYGRDLKKKQKEIANNHFEQELKNVVNL